MCSPPCTDSAETLVEKVARRMAQKHAFLRSHGRMGSAITSFKDWATLVRQRLFSESEIKFFGQLLLLDTTVQVMANLYVPNLRYHFNHNKKSPYRWFAVVPRHIARNPTI